MLINCKKHTKCMHVVVDKSATVNILISGKYNSLLKVSPPLNILIHFIFVPFKQRDVPNLERFASFEKSVTSIQLLLCNSP